MVIQGLYDYTGSLTDYLLAVPRINQIFSFTITMILYVQLTCVY